MWLAVSCALQLFCLLFVTLAFGGFGCGILMLVLVGLVCFALVLMASSYYLCLWGLLLCGVDWFWLLLRFCWYDLFIGLLVC